LEDGSLYETKVQVNNREYQETTKANKVNQFLSPFLGGDYNVKLKLLMAVVM
jgi:uncharacterized membrane protein YvbJ